MNQKEYIYANLSRWERMKTNFLYVPGILLLCYIAALLIASGVYEQDFEMNPIAIFIWIIMVIIGVILNRRGARRIQALKEKWNTYRGI